jgi:hypothetical protein
MNNTIKHLPNGDFEVVPEKECEDKVTELDDSERIEFERKRNYPLPEWDDWKPIE